MPLSRPYSSDTADAFGKFYDSNRVNYEPSGNGYTGPYTMFELATLAGVVLQAEGGGAPLLSPLAAAALAVGLGALGTGIAQRGIGAAAVGAVAEDDDMFVRALIFTALPETLIIIAFVTIFLTQ